MNSYFLQLKKDIPNDIGWIRRILAYAFDWYVGGMIASLPVIIIYMMLHKDATYIPQNLSIFHAPYNVIAGSLSLIVAIGYYVLVPMFVFKGQTLGRIMSELSIWYGVQIKVRPDQENTKLTLITNKDNSLDEVFKFITEITGVEIIKIGNMEYRTE